MQLVMSNSNSKVHTGFVFNIQCHGWVTYEYNYRWLDKIGKTMYNLFLLKFSAQSHVFKHVQRCLKISSWIVFYDLPYLRHYFRSHQQHCNVFVPSGIMIVMSWVVLFLLWQVSHIWLSIIYISCFYASSS